MKDYASAFLGLILAGVLMMVIGLGLMMSSAGDRDGSHPAAASALPAERSAVYAERSASPTPPPAMR